MSLHGKEHLRNWIILNCLITFKPILGVTELRRNMPGGTLHWLAEESPVSKRSHCKSLKTYCEKFSWFEKYDPKSRKYYNIFLKTRKINSLRKIFLSLLQENLTWNKNISQNRTNFLNIKKTFLSKKIFLVSRKLFLFWDNFLKLRWTFLCKGRENFLSG